MTRPKKIKPWIFLSFFALLFTGLLLARTGFFSRELLSPVEFQLSFQEAPQDRNTWMNIYQDGNKIGYSNTRYAKANEGYRFFETAFMRINTMGLVQDMGLKTSGMLNADFSLASFTCQVSSGRFSFSAHGAVSGALLNLTLDSAGSRQAIKLNLSEKIYLPFGILQAAVSGGIRPGKRLSLKVFDPVTLGQESIRVEILDQEEIIIMGQPQKAAKLSLKYKGVTQLAWIDQRGEILKEQGMLGITLEKTSREDALFGFPLQPSQDLTQLASIPSNFEIRDPVALSQLKAEISGIQGRSLDLQGGRQSYQAPVLTIKKERIGDGSILTKTDPSNADIENYLKPEPLIQSDNKAVRGLARRITADTDDNLEKVIKIVSWIQEHIEKRPVLSMPDALAVLENRMGDCNEHAVLFAAIARACGIPTKIEAGVVYLRKRFYYHAWNAVYIGKWVTVDALFNQIPADVTHIRLTRGEHRDQLDILGLVGTINIKLLDGTR